jgi:hypothetical protein
MQGGLPDVGAALGDQGDQLTFHEVDTLAYLGQRGALGDVGHGNSFRRGIKRQKTKRPRVSMPRPLVKSERIDD